MGNRLTCRQRHGGRLHRFRCSRSESASFDFRAPEELLRAHSVVEEEEVGLDPTTIPAWLEESLGLDMETWLHLADSLHTFSSGRLEARLATTLSPARMLGAIQDLADRLSLNREKLAAIVAARLECHDRPSRREKVASWGWEESGRRPEETPKSKRRLLFVMTAPLLLSLLLALIFLI
jgi:hypothetical protein